jgi:hypothetical protein
MGDTAKIEKFCTKCGKSQALSEFYARRDGRPSSYCKVCTKEKSSEYRRNNPSAAAAAMKRARNKKLEVYKEKARALAKKRVASGAQAKASAAYIKRHPEIHAARQASRRAAKVNATPSWADMTAITKVYAAAKELSKRTGVLHVVDHIVPLRGKSVCGLHVEHNLQVISDIANKVKGIKHD